MPGRRLRPQTLFRARAPASRAYVSASKSISPARAGPAPDPTLPGAGVWSCGGGAAGPVPGHTPMAVGRQYSGAAGRRCGRKPAGGPRPPASGCRRPPALPQGGEGLEGVERGRSIVRIPRIPRNPEIQEFQEVQKPKNSKRSKNWALAMGSEPPRGRSALTPLHPAQATGWRQTGLNLNLFGARDKNTERQPRSPRRRDPHFQRQRLGLARCGEAGLDRSTGSRTAGGAPGAPRTEIARMVRPAGCGADGEKTI